MFKDIRVVAALRTLVVFGMAVVVGLITNFVMEKFGLMAVLTVMAVVFTGYMAYSVYEVILLGLKHEKEYKDLSESLDEKETTI